MFNSILSRLGYVRKARPFSDYIAFKETLKAANESGLSVGDYIENKYCPTKPTALDQTFEGMVSLGVFDARIEQVCELGPGSGRYLEKTIAHCHPAYYEIYETSSDWRNWLVSRHNLVARTCDGKSLSATNANSIDLVQAHKLFSGIPFLSTVSYLQEMSRVVSDGGWVVFDIMTEECFRPECLHQWFNANPWEWDWSPHVMPRDFTIRLLLEKGISLVGSFQVPLFPAVTECLVFRKLAAGLA
ncbi:MAG: hypothetical protein NVS9B5_27460 [Terriglobales bacterium]